MIFSQLKIHVSILKMMYAICQYLKTAYILGVSNIIKWSPPTFSKGRLGRMAGCHFEIISSYVITRTYSDNLVTAPRMDQRM